MVAQFQVLNKILQDNDYSIILDNSFNSDYFYNYKAEFDYISDHFKKYNQVPDIRTFKSVFPEFKVENVSESNDFLVNELITEYNGSVLVSQYNQMRDLLVAQDFAKAVELQKQFEGTIKTAGTVNSIDLAKDRGRLDRYLERASGAVSDYYLTTGFKELDELTGGIDLKNENMCIVARTGVGKSWILLAMAGAAFAKGNRVGIYSGEMHEDKVGYRIDTVISHISNKGLNRGDAFIRAQYADYISHLNSDTLSQIIPDFVDGGALKVVTPAMLGNAATVDKLRKFIEKDKLDILFVDQYSLLEDTSRARQTNEKVANISKDIKNLQVITQIPIIAVSQMNRQGGKDDEGNDKEADSTQIGLTDRIGQDATTLIYLNKKALDPKTGKVAKKIEPGVKYTRYVFDMTIGKARDGGEGKLSYAVDLDTFTYDYFKKDDKLADDYEGDVEGSDSDEYRLDEWQG